MCEITKFSLLQIVHSSENHRQCIPMVHWNPSFKTDYIEFIKLNTYGGLSINHIPPYALICTNHIFHSDAVFNGLVSPEHSHQHSVVPPSILWLEVNMISWDLPNILTLQHILTGSSMFYWPSFSVLECWVHPDLFDISCQKIVPVMALLSTGPRSFWILSNTTIFEAPRRQRSKRSRRNSVAAFRRSLRNSKRAWRPLGFSSGWRSSWKVLTCPPDFDPVLYL